MANPTDPPAPERTLNISEIEPVKVRVTGDHRMQVEFRIQDLVKKLLPSGVAAGHCGGCNGCMGCSM
jgi:hypothetical protein